MEIQIGNERLQTPRKVTIELFNDVVPLTADNFYQLCKGTCTGRCTENNPPGTLVGSPFHRVIPNFMIQGGDFTLGNGKNTIFYRFKYHLEI